MAKGKYSRKRILQKLRTVPIEDGELSEFIIKALSKAGMRTMADLMLCDEAKIKDIPGIGDKAIQEITNLKKVNWKADK